MFIENMGLNTLNNKSIMNEYCAYVILFFFFKLPTECDKITNVHQDCFFEGTHNIQLVCLIISLKIHADPFILHYSEVMCM